jgi:iron complex outermembrane receptor protein
MRDIGNANRGYRNYGEAVRRAALAGTSLLALCSGVTIATQANAQTAASATASAPTDSTGGSEVVVTARARAEKLIDVPVSVQSFSASKLAADNIVDINALQYEAGFTFNSQGSSYSGGGREFPSLIFRGMSSNLSSSTGGSSGAVFVDGIYISGGLASVTLADASQVEVLKGPQNVYFGKNTAGGAINLITANPTEDFHASATAGYSYKGSYDDVGSVEGAIIPGLLTAKVTGELFHQGEQYKAADGGPLGEEDTKAISVVLYATPTSGSWLRARFHYAHDDDSTAQDGFIDPGVYGISCPGLSEPSFCGKNLPTLDTLNPKSVLSGTVMPQALLQAIQTDNFGGGAQQLWLNKVPRIDHSGLDRDNIQGSIAGGTKLPYDATFQFSAGFNQADADDLTAADHTPSPFFITNTATISRDFEADARILTSASQPIRAVVGVNHFQSVNQLAQGGDYGGFLAASFAAPINETDKTDAAYGSLDWDILHDLTLTGEVRYQKDTVSDVVAPLVVSKSYDHTLPRVILKYHPTSTTNVYLSYSEGIQPPQLQTSYIDAQAAAASSGHNYEEQALAKYGVDGDFTGDPKIRVWEIGWKQSLFQDRVFISADYYNEFWDHALVQTFIFDPPGCTQLYGLTYAANGSATCALGSSGAAPLGLSNNHIQGIEFDGTARVTSKLTTHLAFNWTDAIRKEYDDNSYGSAFTSGTVPSQNGLRVNLVPQYQWSADFTYKDHLVGPYDWYAHGVLNYTGSQYVDATDITQIEGYARVNLSAGVTRGNVTFEGYVTNLFDNKDWDMGVRFPGSPANGLAFDEAYLGAIVTAPNPRDVGFKITAKY